MFGISDPGIWLAYLLANKEDDEKTNPTKESRK